MNDISLKFDDPVDGSDREKFADAVVAGLSQTQKSLPTAYLYDQRGSELFEEITELDEYYQTRTEISVLEALAAEWVSGLPEGTTLVEFGSGSSRKTEVLLSVGSRITDYAPIDVSPSALDGAVRRLMGAVLEHIRDANCGRLQYRRTAAASGSATESRLLSGLDDRQFFTTRECRLAAGVRAVVGAGKCTFDRGGPSQGSRSTAGRLR